MANDPSTMQQILQMVGNGNPKDIFYSKCKEMNINPDTILSMLGMK